MTVMETVKDRLIKFIAYLKIGQGKFEKHCNLSNGFVSNIRDGFSTPNLSKIAIACPDLNLEWLITGKGPMLKPDSPSSVQLSDRSANYQGTFTEPINTIMGSGNTVGGSAHEKIAAVKNNKLMQAKAETMELRRENETLTGEIIRLRNECDSLRNENEILRKSNEELHKSLIEEKERMIKILLEKK